MKWGDSMPKNKRVVVLLFIILFMNDICRYIKEFVISGTFKIDRISLFFGSACGHSILHTSIIYFMIVVVIYFFVNFFKRDEF